MSYVAEPVTTAEYSGFNHKLADLVSFPAYDGTILRGNIYKPQAPPPATGYPTVIMTQGLALLKEHYLHNWANHFARAGYLVLAYDHRNFGHSEGTPRNEVNPIQQADDYIDAVTYVLSRKDVDPKKVVTWGIGHSGGAAGTAASQDRRLAGTILLMPSTNGKIDEDSWGEAMNLVKAARESRAIGSAETNKRAEFLQFWPHDAQDRDPKTGIALLKDDVAWNWHHDAMKDVAKGGNKFDNKVAVSSMFYIFRARPLVYFKDIAPTPVLYIAATKDFVATPYKESVEVFETMKEPKRLVTLTGEHLPAYFNAKTEAANVFTDGMKAQLDWLGEVFSGKIHA